MMRRETAERPREESDAPEVAMISDPLGSRMDSGWRGTRRRRRPRVLVAKAAILTSKLADCLSVREAIRVVELT